MSSECRLLTVLSIFGIGFMLLGKLGGCSIKLAEKLVIPRIPFFLIFFFSDERHILAIGKQLFLDNTSQLILIAPRDLLSTTSFNAELLFMTKVNNTIKEINLFMLGADILFMAGSIVIIGELARHISIFLGLLLSGFILFGELEGQMADEFVSIFHLELLDNIMEEMNHN